MCRSSRNSPYGTVRTTNDECFIKQLKPQGPKEMSSIRRLCLASWNLFYGLSMMISTVIILPTEAKRIWPESSSVFMGLCMLGFSLGQVFSPLGGKFSDVLKTPFGGRRSVLLGANLLGLATIIAMYYASMHSLAGLYVVMVFFNNCLVAACFSCQQGFMADLLPESQRGSQAGIANVFMICGALGGIGLGQVIAFDGSFAALSVYYAVIATVMAVCTVITVAAAKGEQRQKFTIEYEGTISNFCFKYSGVYFMLYENRKHRNYYMLTIARSCFYGALCCKMYFNYLVRDRFMLKTHQEVVSFASTVAIVAECGLLVGAIIGTKAVSYVRSETQYAFGMIWMGFGYLMLTFIPKEHAIAGIFVFGIGNGIAVVADGALAIECIPDQSQASYYLGFSAIAVLLGGMVSATFCSVAVSLFPDGKGGYTAEGYFFCFLVGTLMLWAGAYIMRKVRSPKNDIDFGSYGPTEADVESQSLIQPTYYQVMDDDKAVDMSHVV
jgi:MFS family permease